MGMRRNLKYFFFSFSLSLSVVLWHLYGYVYRHRVRRRRWAQCTVYESLDVQKDEDDTAYAGSIGMDAQEGHHMP